MQSGTTVIFTAQKRHIAKAEDYRFAIKIATLLQFTKLHLNIIMPCPLLLTLAITLLRPLCVICTRLSLLFQRPAKDLLHY